MLITNPKAVVVLVTDNSEMKSGTPKVLHAVCGTSMLLHALNTARQLEPEQIIVILNEDSQEIENYLLENAKDIHLVKGDRGNLSAALTSALELVDAKSAQILLTRADMPLIQPATLHDLLQLNLRENAAASFLGLALAKDVSLGEIELDQADYLIVQPKKSLLSELNLQNLDLANSVISSGVAAYEIKSLKNLLSEAEFAAFTWADLINAAVEKLPKLAFFTSQDHCQLKAVNNRCQLMKAGLRKNLLNLEKHLANGVTIIDPNNTYIEDRVEIEADATILPGVHLQGTTQIAAGAVIGPDTTLKNVKVGALAEVVRTHAYDAIIGPEVSVGPFAYLRPGTVLETGSKIGTFVEVKNSNVGPEAKIPHLSYVGDADIGEGTNIGAATIFANYDGVNKHRSKVGKHVRIGSDSVLVAPVTVGDGAMSGAGTLIRKDIAPGDLMVNNIEPKIKSGWIFEKRGGTKAAKAAELAKSQEENSNN